MEFLYAAELKKRFACYGHFYTLRFKNGEQVSCRSVLEIVDRTVDQTQCSDLWMQQPDVVVIMMNPGSSHPKEASYVGETLGYEPSTALRKKELILTQPDNTQYQVMRIAVEQGWHHIRVLNLSDLRDPKSGSFLQKVSALEVLRDGSVHSLFCDERSAECTHALNRKESAPIMLGWGRDSGLLPLAERCMRRLEGQATFMVPVAEHPQLNAHPSPMLQKKKLEWLQRMLEVLDA